MPVVDSHTEVRSGMMNRRHRRNECLKAKMTSLLARSIGADSYLNGVGLRLPKKNHCKSAQEKGSAPSISLLGSLGARAGDCICYKVLGVLLRETDPRASHHQPSWCAACLPHRTHLHHSTPCTASLSAHACRRHHHTPCTGSLSAHACRCPHYYNYCTGPSAAHAHAEARTTAILELALLPPMRAKSLYPPHACRRHHRTPCTGSLSAHARRCPHHRNPCTRPSVAHARRCPHHRNPCTGSFAARACRGPHHCTPCTCCAAARLAKRGRSMCVHMSVGWASLASLAPPSMSAACCCWCAACLPHHKARTAILAPALLPPMRAKACTTPQSLHRLFIRQCAQRPAPPQSLHSLFLRLASLALPSSMFRRSMPRIPRPKNRKCEKISTSRQVLQPTQPVQTSSAKRRQFIP